MRVFRSKGRRPEVSTYRELLSKLEVVLSEVYFDFRMNLKLLKAALFFPMASHASCASNIFLSFGIDKKGSRHLHVTDSLRVAFQILHRSVG